MTTPPRQHEHPPAPGSASGSAPAQESACGDAPTVEGVAVRGFDPADQPAVSRLYEHGLLEGQVSPNDTAADVDHVQQAYFDNLRHHFWVADCDGTVVGMIAVGSDEDDVAEVRRLRVDPAHQHRPVAALLLHTALAHCRKQGFLKVRFDTRFEKSSALRFFEEAGFHHTRTRNAAGKELLEFYVDLYREPDQGARRQGPVTRGQ